MEYNRVMDLERLQSTKEKRTLSPSSLRQAEEMARVAGIVLSEKGKGTDPRVALYASLREDVDVNLKGEFDYSHLDDQHLFAEVLRMLGDTDSLKKFLKAYSNIFPAGK